MPKYQPYSRRALRTSLVAWTRANARVAGVLGVGLVAMLALTTWIIARTGEAPVWMWYVLGATHAFLVGGFLYAMASTFVAYDREAVIHLRGAWGEENTRSELRRARRKKIVWGWVDSVTLAAGDIDHLVVTRAGGLVALDSKWRNRASGEDRDAMARSAQRARLRSEGVVQSLLRRERGGHRASGAALRVRSAVVVWGGWSDDIPPGAQVDGVDFVRGRDLVGWLRALDGEAVTSAAAKDLVRRLEAFRAEAWPAPVTRTSPVPVQAARRPTGT